MHRILVVEDDPRTAGTISLYLEHDGFETRVAPSAVRRAAASPAPIFWHAFLAGITKEPGAQWTCTSLRKIEGNPAQPALIATVFGAGYKWMGEHHEA